MGLKTKTKVAEDATPLFPSLRTIPFLRDAPPKGLKAAEAEARYFGLPGGWQLFGPGDPSDQIYFVLSMTAPGAVGAGSACQIAMCK